MVQLPGKRAGLWMLVLVALLGFLLPASMRAETGNGRLVYEIPVEGSLATGLGVRLERGFEQAKAREAQAIMLNMKKVEGTIDEGIELGAMIRRSELPVIAYADGPLAGAGAYLALSATHLAISPGGSLNAPQDRPEEEHRAALWNSEMRAAAEHTGRDPQLAAALADPGANRPGHGAPLQLTGAEAAELRLADGPFAAVQDVLQRYGYAGAAVETYKPSFAEQVAAFLTQPWVIPILLVVGLVGLTIELMLPGHFVPGLLGALSLGGYFYGHMAAGFAGWESAILFMAGLLLMAAEVFITGFGLIGAAGVLALGGGVVLAAHDASYGLKMMLIAVAASAVTVWIVIKFFGHLGVWNRLVHTERQEKEAGYTPSSRNTRHMMYQVGRAVTPLRPAGTAVFHGQRFDVVSDGEFLPADTEVIIVLIEGTRIVVRRKNKGENVVIPRKDSQE